MDIYRTEEEQVEALRGWWRENGRSTLLAIALAVAGGLGWQGWQEHRRQQAEEASVRYDEMLEAIDEAETDEEKATARHLAESLEEEYDGTAYAAFAGLYLARMAVEEGDLEAAESALRNVLIAADAEELRSLAQLRLARVLAAAGDAEGGLAVLSDGAPGAWAPAWAEARGDMYLQLDRREEAATAFQEASDLVEDAGRQPGRVLQLKLQSLKPVPARELDTEPDAEPDAEGMEAAIEPETEPEMEPAMEEAAEGSEEEMPEDVQKDMQENMDSGMEEEMETEMEPETEKDMEGGLPEGMEEEMEAGTETDTETETETGTTEAYTEGETPEPQSEAQPENQDE